MTIIKGEYIHTVDTLDATVFRDVNKGFDSFPFNIIPIFFKLYSYHDKSLYVSILHWRD